MGGKSDLLTWVVLLPAGQVIQIVVDPPQSLTVVNVSLGSEPLCCELPCENVSVMEIFISRVLRHFGRGVMNCPPISRDTFISLYLLHNAQDLKYSRCDVYLNVIHTGDTRDKERETNVILMMQIQAETSR